MGANPEWFKNCTPQYIVYVPAFYIDKYEVTNAEYKRFDKDHFYLDSEADMPVTNITWYDAMAYCKWAGKRLPTEEEWEKAARGPFGRLFPWGDKLGFNKSYSNALRLSEYNGLVPVWLFIEDKSPYGVMDMGGNACEWTLSRYLPYPGNKIFNRKYGQDYYVIKGGSFLYDKLEAFCANRKCGRPNLRNIDIGFRCVMSVEDYIKKYGREKHIQNIRAQTKN